MLSIIISVFVIVLVSVLSYLFQVKSKAARLEKELSAKDASPVKPDDSDLLNQVKQLEQEKSSLQSSIDRLTSEMSVFEVEKKKYEEKSKKVWSMSEAVYKEKKRVDDQNASLQVEKEKLETEKKKVEEKVKKLWSQSIAIHKEKERINELKVEIEKKHTEIIDSVNYAKRIQEAILPEMREIVSHLTDSFILFQPRDIVSGDFYWFSNKDGKKIIAAIDCTGHGVPGAFMSMIGNTLLNQIVNERGITDPADILNNLNKEVNRALKQTNEDSESRDGMDGAICCFEFPSAENGATETKVCYSGANRPLWFIRNNELNEIKADKFPIGGLEYEDPKEFTTHTLDLQKGDTVYTFTDGYADQFGQVTNKKLMTKKFKEALLSIQDKPMGEQHSYLKTFINNWKGTNEQTDDILVIGVKI